MKPYLNKETHCTLELGKSLFFLLFLLISSVFSAASAAPVVTYIHTDTLGSPIAATNSSGELVWRESYKPFGERMEKSSQAGARKPWYTGHVQDQDTGLVYMGARYYDPQVGRFMSTDPVGFLDDKPMQFNRYAYANNNPYTYVDPDGEIAAHVGKFFLDFSLNLAINYVESGQLNVMDAAIDSASNLMNPAASVKKISRVAQIVQGSKKVTNSGASSAKQAANLKEHLRQADKYGKGGVKDLQNGKTRYYGETIPAKKQGEMAGRRTVREWDPATGNKRTWHETVDHSGNVRQVRPEFNNGTMTHYTFDKNGNYTGSW